ncbi:hypothetical protein JCM3765_005463 [Sporobolomyces pararoseus]
MFSHSSRLDPLPSSFPSLLSSLPLQPPQQLPTSIYHSILSSPHWLEHKFTKLQTLGDEDESPGGGHRVIETAYGSTGCVNAMDWEEGGEERLASAGDDTKICIWKPGYLKRRNSTTSSSQTRNDSSPFPGYGLSETIDTGHRANIFSIKWAPSNPHRLFSAAGDCTARVFDLSLSSNSSLSTTSMNTIDRSPSSSSSLHLPWSHHSTSACIKIINCHTDRVKRISTEPFHSGDSTFLTCSEDGTVRQHDLRLPHQCRTTSNRFGGMRRGERNESCPEPLTDYGNSIRLYSMSLSNLQPHLFAVSGTSPFAYLHDRRMLKTPMIRDWSISPCSQNLTECVRRFGVPSSSDGSKDSFIESIVAVKMNPFNSRELIASYSDLGIYRFDIYGESFQREQQQQQQQQQQQVVKKRNVFDKEEEEEEEEGEEAGDDGDELIGDGELMGKELRERSKREGEDDMEGGEEEGGIEKKKKTKIEKEDCQGVSSTGLVEGEDVQTEACENNEIGRAQEEDGNSNGVGNDSEVVSESNEPSQPIGENDQELDTSAQEEEELFSSSSSSSSSNSPFSSNSPHSTVPLIPPITHYTGHSNSQTVKDVNFSFKGNLIVTGSDDGNFFGFEKLSGKCVGIFLGDSSVVNVLQPHPRLPLIAISGIDSTIKIFGPGPTTTTSNDDDESLSESLGNLVKDFEQIKKRNQQGRLLGSSNRFTTSGLPDTLLRLIAARMNEIQQQRGVGGEEDEDEGERGPIRLVFGDGGGNTDQNGGEERNVDCVVM